MNITAIKPENLEHIRAQPTRQIDLSDAEMGLISLAISIIASGKIDYSAATNGLIDRLSGYDADVLKLLEQRVSNW